MSPLRDGLERILSYLEENDLETARFESLQPGLTSEEIDQITTNLPFRLPIEMYQLYQWGNGAWQDEESNGQYFLDCVFLPLESAVKIYQAVTNTLDPRAYQHPQKIAQVERHSVRTSWVEALISYLTSDSWAWICEKWHPQIFPLAWNLNSDGCYAVLGNSCHQETTPILDVWFNDDSYYGEYYIKFPSLTKMVQSEAERYEANIYNYQNDLEELQEIQHKYQDQPIRLWRSPDFIFSCPHLSRNRHRGKIY